MVQEIGREDVQRLVERGAQLVEVLPSAEFNELHLAGAISIPLTELNQESAAHLERNRPTIVYCYDNQ